MTMKNIHGWTIPAAKGLRPIENLIEGKEFFLRYLLVEPVEPACPTKMKADWNQHLMRREPLPIKWLTQDVLHPGVGVLKSREIFTN